MYGNTFKDYPLHLGDYSEQFSPGTLAKARQHRGNLSMKPEPHCWLFRSSNGEYSQRVVYDGKQVWITCDCPNGKIFLGHAVCYHAAAVLLRELEMCDTPHA